MDNRKLNWSYDNNIGDDYYIFILGYDILSWKFKDIDVPCDEAFELACKIWNRFTEYEKMFGAEDCSTYNALWDFADAYIDMVYLDSTRI